MSKTKYTVRGYRSDLDADIDRGCEIDTGADTLAEAKRIARHWLSAEFTAASESSGLMYAAVYRGGECVEDFRAA